MDKFRKAYEEDPQIRRTVDMMEAYLHEYALTPHELRQCAVLASIKYFEMSAPRPISRNVEKHLMALQEELKEPNQK